jgi:hypothetical protein
MRNKRLKMMIVAALFAAIIAVAAQIMINMPPVPFTLMTIAVMLTATILGAKYGTLAVSVYVLMGGIGIPVCCCTNRHYYSHKTGSSKTCIRLEYRSSWHKRLAPAQSSSHKKDLLLRGWSKRFFIWGIVLN